MCFASEACLLSLAWLVVCARPQEAGTPPLQSTRGRGAQTGARPCRHSTDGAVQASSLFPWVDFEQLSHPGKERVLVFSRFKALWSLSSCVCCLAPQTYPQTHSHLLVWVDRRVANFLSTFVVCLHVWYSIFKANIYPVTCQELFVDIGSTELFRCYSLVDKQTLTIACVSFCNSNM